MTEVAKRAQVSIATVSNVIYGTRKVSGQRADRVRAALRELNYHPNQIARSLKVKQTRLLAMVLPDITNPFFPQIVRGAEDAAFSRDYLLVSANTDEQPAREQRILASLWSYRIDGLLLASTGGNAHKETSHLHAMLRAGLPIVCLDRSVPKLKTDAILLDNQAGARACVRHLIEQGHKRIAVITGPLELQTGAERLAGYQQAMSEAGLRAAKELTVEADFRIEGGRRAALRLLQGRVRPTAIFVCNGLMAAGVVRAFEEAGVAPLGEIALACFDDISGDGGAPSHITSVVQPSYQMGYQAASMLIDRVEGKLPKRTSILRIAPKLVLRESTALRLLKPKRANSSLPRS